MVGPDGSDLRRPGLGAAAKHGSIGASLTATYDVDPGETVTCTFENTKRATLIVDKEILPRERGPRPVNFTHFPALRGRLHQYYDYTEGQYYSQSNLLGGQNRQMRPPRPRCVHDLRERSRARLRAQDDQLRRRQLPTPSTVDPFPGYRAPSGSATFQLDPGETVQCTFTNEDQRGVIVLDKQMAPGGLFGRLHHSSSASTALGHTPPYEPELLLLLEQRRTRPTF